MKLLSKYLFKQWLLLLAFSLGLSFAVSLLCYKAPSSAAHASYRGTLVVWSLFGVFFMALGALSMLANLSKKVRSSALLRFLSFYLLPTALLCVEANPLKANAGAKLSLLFWSVILPFYLCLTLVFILFLRRFCTAKALASRI